MTNLFLLIDSRAIRHRKIDMEFMEWLAENGVPFSIVFTKTDKLSKENARKNVESYCNKLLENMGEPASLYLSPASTKRSGKEELLAYIDEMNRLPTEANQRAP